MNFFRRKIRRNNNLLIVSTLLPSNELMTQLLMKIIPISKRRKRIKRLVKRAGNEFSVEINDTADYQPTSASSCNTKRM